MDFSLQKQLKRERRKKQERELKQAPEEPMKRSSGACSMLPLPLPSGVVDARFALQQQLRDGDNGIALGLEGFDDPGQGLRRVDGRVVEEDDAARPHVLQHPPADLLRLDALPDQTVAVP